MNTIDDCVHHRLISCAKEEDGRLLIVLDGGELLTVYATEGGLTGGPQLTWSYQTNPSPRTLLGLGAPTRPRGGHARPLEDQRTPEAVAYDEDITTKIARTTVARERWSANVVPRDRAFRALQMLYNWRREHGGVDYSHVVRQAAYQAVTEMHVWDAWDAWDDLKQWDRAQGGETSGQRQAGAASEPTPEDAPGPESPGRKDADKSGLPDGRPADGAAKPDLYRDAGADEVPDPGPFSPPGPAAR